ncbi:aminotransferase class V-fold PLP-dependent enzyme [Neorhodopirellula pilleata]|uniref:cysteine desulfurase n=1 Tax=Neorhodopirellula pilleata TaxID=2714738 RepID=A0A5C6AMS3_9BACT|nr:aminotransferase class V-fold PLP-dependent enzyme [Neorhodopirellula pilleata]TWU01353.1 putative cysteine desulfurase [Neorhodopirellula pilleata]
MKTNRLYLDHASTSWPKAPGVVEAMVEFMVDTGASASRGNYAAARQAQRIVDRVRRRLTEHVEAESSACVTFHSGCTAAINAAVHGILRPGDHAVVSAVEHNSVLRPMYAATAEPASSGSTDQTANVTVVPCDSRGDVSVQAMIQAITQRTRMIALTHASNVTGIIQPVAELSRAIARINETRRQSGHEQDRIWFLCDAAQTFGYFPINVQQLGVDILAAPAHKGCGGPPGIAMLVLSPPLHDLIRPTIQGGSGQDGLSDHMPATMPGRLEAGTMNVPAIAGWDAALDRMVQRQTMSGAIPEEITVLANRLHDGLAQVDGIRVVGRRGELPIASVDFGPMLPASDAAAILDQDFSIDVRAGYHCASRLHDYLDTRAHGTLRVSAGHGTTEADLDRVIAAISEISESLPMPD